MPAPLPCLFHGVKEGSVAAINGKGVKESINGMVSAGCDVCVGIGMGAMKWRKKNGRRRRA